MSSEEDSTLSVVKQQPQEQIKYQIIRQIGQGAEGPVYLVDVTERKQKLVLKSTSKYLSSQEIDRFINFNHKNVIQIQSFGFNQQKQIYFMSYANGGDLNHFMVERQLSQKYLKIDEILNIFEQICRGVHYLHSKQVVHGDLSPQNILLHFENRIPIVKVSDYITNSNHQQFYAAPEVLRGEQPTVQSDIWSLGIILFQMNKFRLPFMSTPKGNDVKQQLEGLPFCFQKIISNCLTQNQQHRISLINIIRALERRVMAPHIKELQSFCSSSVMSNTNIDFELDIEF
ncbi:Kinase [Hexamita inflata]|uniref:Kinase n=1 Tax=Hexamita inflata TaxID=28002 RepID=A0AA86Q3V3_9EUKA|nr:Kinase [Hexamita inflata]